MARLYDPFFLWRARVAEYTPTHLFEGGKILLKRVLVAQNVRFIIEVAAMSMEQYEQFQPGDSFRFLLLLLRLIWPFQSRVTIPHLRKPSAMHSFGGSMLRQPRVLYATGIGLRFHIC